eukprot:UN03057
MAILTIFLTTSYSRQKFRDDTWTKTIWFSRTLVDRVASVCLGMLLRETDTMHMSQ